MKSIWTWFKELDGYKKRGSIYILAGVLLLLYHLLFTRPIDPTGVILCLGIIGVGILVMTVLKPHEPS